VLLEQEQSVIPIFVSEIEDSPHTSSELGGEAHTLAKGEQGNNGDEEEQVRVGAVDQDGGDEKDYEHHSRSGRNYEKCAAGILPFITAVEIYPWAHTCVISIRFRGSQATPKPYWVRLSFLKELLKHVDYLLRRVARPVRMLVARPPLAGPRLHLGPDGPFVEAHDPRVTGLDGLGPLGRGAQDDNELPDAGRRDLLLEAAGVGEDEGAVLEQSEHVEVADRGEELEVLDTPENGHGNLNWDGRWGKDDSRSEGGSWVRPWISTWVYLSCNELSRWSINVRENLPMSREGRHESLNGLRFEALQNGISLNVVYPSKVPEIPGCHSDTYFVPAH